MTLPRRVDPRWVLSIFVLSILAGPQARGATLIRVGFDELVSGSEVIVRATVVDQTCFERSMGAGRAAQGAPRDPIGRAPVSERSWAVVDEPAAAERPRAGGPPDPARPTGRGTEGGRMVFTEIVLAVDEVLKGTTGATITLRQPGGKVDGRRVVVFGLPDFEPGGDYLLFLRPGYEGVGDPVVGVNQGFFSIVTDDATGEELLLDVEGSTVVGIERNRILTQRRPLGSGESRERVVGPPKPDPGYEDVVHGSASDPSLREASAAPLSVPGFERRIRISAAEAPKEAR